LGNFLFDIPAFRWSPYPLIIVLAVLLGFASAALLMKRFGIARQTIFYTCLLTLMTTMMISISATLRITNEGLRLGFSGIAAGIGMILGIFISSLIFRDKPVLVLSSFVPAAPLMYGLSKLGCFLAGCCHGKAYQGHFAVAYHNQYEGTYFPVQLVDMAVFILIHILALILVMKMKNKAHAIFIVIFITLPSRFVLEYFRYTHDGTLISRDQIIILIAAAIAFALLIAGKIILKPKNA